MKYSTRDFEIRTELARSMRKKRGLSISCTVWQVNSRMTQFPMFLAPACPLYQENPSFRFLVYVKTKTRDSGFPLKENCNTKAS